MPFRDKELMKQVLDAAGIRTPWHVSAATVAGVWEAAERVGFPLIVKPIAGAGLGRHLPGRLRRGARRGAAAAARTSPQVSVEEFVDAEEFTYDTVCANGSILFEHMLWYRPRPAADADARVGQPGVASRCATSPCPHLQDGRADGRGRCWPRSASAAGSRTWSGTARTTARSSSARSAPARREPGSST